MFGIPLSHVIEKWCPFSRIICVGNEDTLFKKQGGCRTSFNRVQKGTEICVPRACRCISESCAAWKGSKCTLAEK